jgi:hypothetical protein
VHPDTCDYDINGGPVARKSGTRSSSLALYVSRDGVDFAEVCMPTQLTDSAYTMVSTQDGRGNFMIADHHNQDAAISNMCVPRSRAPCSSAARFVSKDHPVHVCACLRNVTLLHRHNSKHDLSHSCFGQPWRCTRLLADQASDMRAVTRRYANGNIAELYTLSLRNVHFGFRRGSKPDIKSLRPIFGRYIVNVLESPLGPGKQPISDRTFSAVTVTKLTHNAGASWVRAHSLAPSLGALRLAAFSYLSVYGPACLILRRFICARTH